MFKNTTAGVKNVEFRVHLVVNNSSTARTLKVLSDASLDFTKFEIDGGSIN